MNYTNAIIIEGDMGGPEHCNTAKKNYDHCKKSRRNTVSTTIIFSYMILTSTLDVICLYKINTSKCTLVNACLRVDTVDTCKSVVLYLLGELVCMKVHEHDWEVDPKSCQVI